MDEKGQGLVEYAIVAVFIVAFVLAVGYGIGLIYDGFFLGQIAAEVARIYANCVDSRGAGCEGLLVSRVADFGINNATFRTVIAQDYVEVQMVVPANTPYLGMFNEQNITRRRMTVNAHYRRHP